MDFKGQYLTYQEYKGLGGTLDLTPFNVLEFEARRRIDELTYNRLVGGENIPDEVKMCEFAIINKVLKAYDEEIGRGKTSESVGSYSVSYNSDIKKLIEDKRIEIQDIISTDLFGVVYNGEHILYGGV
jgi:hypothetical protein